MPCPINPQPPGLFDGNPLQSAFGVWGTIFLALLIGGGLVGAVWGTRQALRQPPDTPQRKYLWVRLGQLGSGLLLLILLNLDILWEVALDAWQGSFALICAAAQDAAHHAKSEANALFMMICILSILNAFLMIYLNSARRRPGSSLSFPL